MNTPNAANWIKRGHSVWSPYSSSATRAIKLAGYKAGDFYGNINQYEQSRSKKYPTFKHFQALDKKNRKIKDIHSLFGLPSIMR